MVSLKHPADPNKAMFEPESFGLLNPEHADNFVPLQFRYSFKNPFSEVASGFIKKFYWESNGTFTTVHNVRQLDEDRIVFYRKQEHCTSEEGVNKWEQIVINR